MKRKLLKQIRAEWRTNLWLCLELLVVSVVMWYVTDYLYVTATIYNRPRGFDTEHCYLLKFNAVTDKNPSFIPGRTDEERNSDAIEILDRLRHLPFVEAASLSSNSYPYNGSNSGIVLGIDSFSTRGFLVRRLVTPDFVKVFRYEGLNGETSEELAEILERGEMLVSGDFLGNDAPPMSEFLHRDFYMGGDTTSLIRLGAVLKPVRYSDYQSFDLSAVFGIPEDKCHWLEEVCIRVRPEKDRDIPARLMEMAESQFHVGNQLLVNVLPFSNVRTTFQRAYTNNVRDMVVMMAFLMVNIFLGLLGTFWFRTQQRAGEIAIRKSMGATDGSVFRRLVGEGLLLLALVTPVAFGIDCLLAWNEFSTYLNGFFAIGRVAVCALIAAALIAMMIVTGILIPATRASRLDPASVLKDE